MCACVHTCPSAPMWECCTRKHCSSDIAALLQMFWRRASSDDLVYMFLTIINAYFAEVPMLQSMRAQASPFILVIRMIHVRYDMLYTHIGCFRIKLLFHSLAASTTALYLQLCLLCGTSHLHQSISRRLQCLWLCCI
jgi:hypothetical protein